MNFETYRHNANDIALELDQVAGIIDQQLGLSDIAKSLRQEGTTARDQRFRVVVVGEFSRGKSTLLNAIMGGSVLPQKVSEATCVVTHIIYGDTPHVKVSFLDGRPADELTLEDFRKHYELNVDDTIDQNIESQERFNCVDCAEVSFPLELCKHGVELVDSPGLGAHPIRRLRTIKNLDKAHAVVMVLDATQLLKDDEVHFLTNILLPRGLRNVFFIINKWNMIDDHVINPADADKERNDLNELIRLRLHPHCVVNGQDRSSDRVFRVNALGALKARLKKPLNEAADEESNIPAFERALQRFLLEDRGRALSDSLRGKLTTSLDGVERYIETQCRLANTPVNELQRSMDAIKPKLDRLRAIRKNIAHYIRSTSSTLQDTIISSLHQHIKKIHNNMPDHVKNFDLSKITNQSLVWAAITDWTRSEENKLQSQIQQCIQPQVQRLLEEQFGIWQKSVIDNECKAVSFDVEKHLQSEVAEYQRVMQEIENNIGSDGKKLDVEEQVRRWITGTEHGQNGPIQLSDVGLGDVIGLLIGGIVTEIVFTTLYATITFGITAIISLLRVGYREYSMRNELLSKITEAIQKGLNNIGNNFGTNIRNQISKGFTTLEQTITGNISTEIDLIENSLNRLIEQKREADFSAQDIQSKLNDAKTQINAGCQRMFRLLDS